MQKPKREKWSWGIANLDEQLCDFLRSIILGPYVWNLYKVSIQYLSLSLDQAVSLNSKQLPEIFVYDVFCLVFLFCFTLQICRCLLSFPLLTPVCCTDALMKTDFKTVECFNELRKSNSLHIMTLSITQAFAPPVCMFLLLNWSTARIAHYRVSLRAFQFDASRNFEPLLAQWSIQAVKSTGKCQNECAVWPTSKWWWISGASLHYIVRIPGTSWGMSYEQVRWGPFSSPWYDSQLLCRSGFPHPGLGAIAELMHKELLSLFLGAR